jgi:hypothetical protein
LQYFVITCTILSACKGVALAQMHFDRGEMAACQTAIDGANAYAI